MMKENESMPSRPVCMVKGCDRQAMYVINNMKGTMTMDNVYLCPRHMGVEICRYLDPDEDILGAYPWDMETGDTVRPIMFMSKDEVEYIEKLIRGSRHGSKSKARHQS